MLASDITVELRININN